MSKILLAFVALIAMFACPVLFLIDHLYVSAIAGAAGIIILAVLLVTAGEKK